MFTAVHFTVNVEFHSSNEATSFLWAAGIFVEICWDFQLIRINVFSEHSFRFAIARTNACMKNVSRNEAKKSNFQNKYLPDDFDLINMYQDSRDEDVWLIDGINKSSSK